MAGLRQERRNLGAKRYEFVHFQAIIFNFKEGVIHGRAQLHAPKLNSGHFRVSHFP